MEDWAEIRRLGKAEGLPIKVIARQMGCSKNTVKAALAGAGPPRYERERRGSIVDAFDSRIRELLKAYPRMPATVIAERVGWPYSPRTISTRVSELRPLYLPPDPASRTSYEAGQIAQNDFWFPMKAPDWIHVMKGRRHTRRTGRDSLLKMRVCRGLRQGVGCRR